MVQTEIQALLVTDVQTALYWMQLLSVLHVLG
jgi:hypothetical protein